jgi:hypothetical protein
LTLVIAIAAKQSTAGFAHRPPWIAASLRSSQRRGHHSSLRAQRSNPWLDLPTGRHGLPRRCAPRKDEAITRHFELLTRYSSAEPIAPSLKKRKAMKIREK